MKNNFNIFIDRLSEYFAHHKGFLPILGILMIVTNWILQFFPGLGWIVYSDLFLHLGAALAILGFLLAIAL